MIGASQLSHLSDAVAALALERRDDEIAQLGAPRLPPGTAKFRGEQGSNLVGTLNDLSIDPHLGVAPTQIARVVGRQKRHAARALRLD